MNSIVSKRVVTKTDLIEQQAERIAELEAYNQTRTDELAAAARRIAELEAAERERTALALELTEEVERQEARIKELEAENARLKDACNKFSESEILEGDKLAALRQRIADAPVVALVVDDPHAIGWTKTRMLKPCVDGTKLISKEDLL